MLSMYRIGYVRSPNFGITDSGPVIVVTTGESDGTYTEIVTGNLKDGDRVIVAALANAAPASGGSPVSQTGSKGGRGPGF